MDNATCVWDGCDRRPTKRGYCDRCYKRARKTGALDLDPRYGTCRYCGVRLIAGRAGPVPTQCAECAETRRREGMYATWRAQREAAFQTTRRWATCADCGEQFERNIRDTKSFQCKPCRAAAKAEWLRQWAERHPAKAHASKRKWLEANREYMYWRAHRRRVLARSAEADKFARADIFERDGWACQICGLHLDPSVKFPSNDSPSIDHIIPIALGGTHTLDNVQAACMGCNRRKGGRRAA
jgi:5-methylcytosine-specific restriction endonuclease McrA